MPTKRSPRKGSLQFWPHKRSKRIYTSVHAWADVKDSKLLGFAGYKAGMTHVVFKNPSKNATTKGMDISCPATIIECPAMKLLSVRFYKKTEGGLRAAVDVLNPSLDKTLARKIKVPKKNIKKLDEINPEEFDDLVVVMHTQPGKTGIGKKKPEVFEVAVGGSDIKAKLDFAKQIMAKEVNVSDVFKPGQLLDLHVITRGKGFQGVVKKYGVKIRSHKAEKTKRGAIIGSEGNAKVDYTAPQSGKIGYHSRTEYNKLLLQIDDKAEAVVPASGLKKYGVIKNPFILIKGSVAGPVKRLIRFNDTIRGNSKIAGEVNITYIKK